METDFVTIVDKVLGDHMKNYKELYDKTKNILFINKWEAIQVAILEINSQNIGGTQ